MVNSTNTKLGTGEKLGPGLGQALSGSVHSFGIFVQTQECQTSVSLSMQWESPDTLGLRGNRGVRRWGQALEDRVQLESCGASDLGALQRFQRFLLNHLNSAAQSPGGEVGGSFWEPRTLWLFPGRLFPRRGPWGAQVGPQEESGGRLAGA